MAEKWEVRVESDLCQGSGLCTGIAEDRFVPAGRLARAVLPVIEADERVADAAQCCPYQAITVIESATGRVLYPED